MLEGIRAILSVISSMIDSLVAFFQFLGQSIVSMSKYIVIMPAWISILVLSVMSILVVRLIVGR